MRGVFLSVVAATVVLAGCSEEPTVQWTAEKVRSAMQDKLSADPKYGYSEWAFAVSRVDVLKRSGDKGEGVATVRLTNGSAHKVPVVFTFDGESVTWETEPGALQFLLDQAAPPELPPPPPPEETVAPEEPPPAEPPTEDTVPPENGGTPP